MIDQDHRVFRLKIDFSLPQDEAPTPVQDRMSKLINQKLIRIMDGLFSEFAEPDLNIKLDLLELDLGKIIIDDFEKELPLRLEEVLRKELSDLVKKTDLRKKVLYRKQVQFRKLELLDFYLRKGSFPWWKPKHINKDYKSLFWELTNDSDNGLKEIFESLIGTEWPRKRIIISFDDEDLKKIVQILRPLNSKTIIAFSDQLQIQHKKEPILKTDQKNFRDIHWELILRHLYENRGSEFNQKSFLKQILSGLAASLNVEYGALLDQLETYVTQIGNAGKQDNSFVKIVLLLAKEKRTLNQKERPDPPPSWTNDLLKGMSEKESKMATAWLGLITGQQEALPTLKNNGEVWMKLLKRLWSFDQRKAIQFIRRTAILDDKANALLSRLSPAMIQKAINVFCPELSDELIALRSDLLQLTKIKGLSNWTVLELEKEINVYLLTFLGMADSKGLDITTILKSLLKKIADASSQSYLEFTAILFKSFSTASTQFYFQSEILVYLRALLREEGVNDWTVDHFLKTPEIKSYFKIANEDESHWVYRQGKESVSEYLSRLERQIEKPNPFGEIYDFRKKPKQIELWMPQMLKHWSDNQADKLLRTLWPGIASFALLWLEDLSALMTKLSKEWKINPLSKLSLKEIIWSALLQSGFQNFTQTALIRESLHLIIKKVQINNEQFLTAIYEEILKQRSVLKLGPLLPKLFERSVETSLVLKFAKPTNQNSTDLSAVPELLSLSLFFEKGELPPGLSTNDLRSIVTDLLLRSPDALRIWLQNLIRNKNWREKLIPFFSTDVLIDLMNLIAAESGAYAYRLFDFVKHLENIKTYKRTVEKYYWEQVGEALYESAWKGFRPRSFILDLLAKIANDQEVDLILLLNDLEEWSTKNERTSDHLLKAIIRRECLNNNVNKERKSFSKSDSADPDFNKMDLSQLKNWLQKWPSGIYNASLINKSAVAQLEAFATYFLSLQQTLKERFWNTVEDRNILSLFEGLLESDQFIQIADVTELIVAVKLNKEQSKQSFFSLEWSTLLLQAILSDRGSLSNRRTFISKLLRDWAKAHSMSYTKLVKMLWPITWNLAPVFRHSASLNLFSQILKEQFVKEGILPDQTGFSNPQNQTKKEKTKEEKPYKKLWDKDKKAIDFDDLWIVQNTGLILLWPYFNVLFERAGLMEESNFIDEIAQQKAIYLLEYLVSGNKAPTEDMLVLNKILCAYPITAPLDVDFKVNKKLRKLCKGLLKTVIGYWEIIGDVSVKGFRETFLMREGTLGLTKENWHLQVVPKTYDVLLKELPWGISTVNLSWMDMVVKVEWE